MRTHAEVLDHAHWMLMEHGIQATARAEAEVEALRAQGEIIEAAFWRRVVRALRDVHGVRGSDRSPFLH